MDLDTPFGMLLFLAIFEVLGGAALGIALRGFLQRDFTGIFFLIWGGGFAGIPFFIGAVTFLTNGQASYFYASAFILLTAIVTVALLPKDFLETKGEPTGAESGAILGALMTMIGGAVVLFNLRDGIGIGLVIGAIVAALGIFIFLKATIGILRSL